MQPGFRINFLRGEASRSNDEFSRLASSAFIRKSTANYNHSENTSTQHVNSCKPSDMSRRHGMTHVTWDTAMMRCVTAVIQHFTTAIVPDFKRTRNSHRAEGEAEVEDRSSLSLVHAAENVDMKTIPVDAEAHPYRTAEDTVATTAIRQDTICRPNQDIATTEAPKEAIQGAADAVKKRCRTVEERLRHHRTPLAVSSSTSSHEWCSR